ncbi:MAG TPA: hypothetical protein VJX74_07475 [Blastocatellia bacterium]|nr:hypothetical protein [Blastocatellia bacterium]
MSGAKKHNWKQVYAELEQLASDNKSGAAEILRRAAEVFSLFDPQAEEKSSDVESARSKIIHICFRIATAQPHMGSLMNLANTVAESVRAAMSADEVIEFAARTARSFSETAFLAAEVATSRAADLIGSLSHSNPAILTHSYSSTVLAALRKAHHAGKKLNVITTESRPILEGRAMAQALAGEGIDVALIADAAADLNMKTSGVQMVLVGADIVKQSELTNKIGTRMIALAASQREIPVYAVCDTSKFVVHSFEEDEKRNADELWPDAPQKIWIRNSYFEPTPLKYFAGVITEEGVLGLNEVNSRAAKMPVDREILDLRASSLLRYD